jgi:hypothetical protein
MKTCIKCKVEKELKDFSKNKASKDGCHKYCKECDKKRAKIYRKNNRARIQKQRLEYRQENREKLSKLSQEYYQQNKEARREYKLHYERDRRANHPTYRLKKNLARRISSALDGTTKSASTIKLLGCTPDQFRKHLESKFTEGMAWNQRGLWVIDHVLPCAAFDLTKKKHQRYCFHWSNLQPLWSLDNLKKSDKHDPEELEKYLQSELPTYE